MRTLRLVALSDDGGSLVLAADGAEGEPAERFELPIDERVRAAARGDARLGAIEDLGNTLPPRVIQARVRAGETPEQVAETSGTRLDRVLRFAHPVLLERARMADQAREARVRLSDGTSPLPLHRFLSERLRLLGGDVDGVRWNAHRDDEGWVVTGEWAAGGASGTASWRLDVAARTVSPLDATTRDFAEGTRLVRVVPDVPTAAAAVPEPAEPAGPAAPPAPDPYDISQHDISEHDIAEHDTVVLGRTGDDGDGEEPRAHVPAWEDIVFGVRRHR